MLGTQLKHQSLGRPGEKHVAVQQPDFMQVEPRLLELATRNSRLSALHLARGVLGARRASSVSLWNRVSLNIP